MLAVSIYYVQRLEDAQSFIKVLFLHVRWLSHLTPILTNVHHPGLVLSSWIGWYYMQRNVAFSMATSDKPSDKVGGLTNRLIMVNGLIMVENERKKRGKRESSCPCWSTLCKCSARDVRTSGSSWEARVYFVYFISTLYSCIGSCIFVYLIPPPVNHQSPTILAVGAFYILNSHKSTSSLPSWVEISTNVLSSEKFEAQELLVEGWTPIPNIQYTQSTTLTRSMVS